VTRCIDTDGVFRGNYEVDIRSQHLSGILSEIYRDADEVSFGAVVSLDEEELQLLYHARSVLSAKLQDAVQARHSELIFELDALLGYTNEHFERVVSDLHALPLNYITFDHLWTLFPPNTLVYTKDNLNQAKLYRVKSSEYLKHRDGTVEYLLHADYLDSDGRQTGHVRRQKLKTNSFQGCMPIQHLFAYPLELHPQHENLRRELILRGEKLLQLQGRRLQEYKGHALQEHKPSFPGDEETTEIFNVCVQFLRTISEPSETVPLIPTYLLTHEL
jgi:hypothetical protein